MYINLVKVVKISYYPKTILTSRSYMMNVKVNVHLIMNAV